MPELQNPKDPNEQRKRIVDQLFAGKDEITEAEAIKLLEVLMPPGIYSLGRINGTDARVAALIQAGVIRWRDYQGRILERWTLEEWRRTGYRPMPKPPEPTITDPVTLSLRHLAKDNAQIRAELAQMKADKALRAAP